MGGVPEHEGKRMEQERGFGFQREMAESDFQRAMEKFRAEVEAKKEAETTAYERMLEQKQADIARATGLMSDAESRLFEETAGAPPELLELQESIRKGNTREQQAATSAMRANLAQSGVRGGQAATLLNRATGEMNEGLTRDLNQLSYDEALGRRQARTGYLGNKATAATGGVVR